MAGKWYKTKIITNNTNQDAWINIFTRQTLPCHCKTDSSGNVDYCGCREPAPVREEGYGQYLYFYLNNCFIMFNEQKLIVEAQTNDPKIVLRRIYYKDEDWPQFSGTSELFTIYWDLVDGKLVSNDPAVKVMEYNSGGFTSRFNYFSIYGKPVELKVANVKWVQFNNDDRFMRFEIQYRDGGVYLERSILADTFAGVEVFDV